MKKIIILFLVTLSIGLSAQSCKSIKDINHVGNCQLFSGCCLPCNYPNSTDSGMIKSWCEGKVIEFTTAGENQFLRFYYTSPTYNNKIGSWLVKESDLHKPNTPLPDMAQIQQILQLTQPPNTYTTVTIPAGVVMLEGLIYGSPRKHCRQFCIKDEKSLLNPAWFGSNP